MIERIKAWSDEAEAGLKKSTDGYEEYFKKEVNEGRASLYKCGNSWLITRDETDKYKNLRIIVVCCYEGEMLEIFVNWLKEKARSSGFDVIRFHTKSPGLCKWMQHKHNFKLTEYVNELRL